MSTFTDLSAEFANCIARSNETLTEEKLLVTRRDLLLLSAIAKIIDEKKSNLIQDLTLVVKLATGNP